MVPKKQVWISWERHQRNRSLAQALGFYLLEIDSKRSGLLRYSRSIIKTIMFFIRERPDIVVAQNPSIILSNLALVCRYIFNYYLIIDAHNSGINPFDGKFKIVNRLSKLIQKKSDLVIVTNEKLAGVVTAHGGNPCIMPDKLPVVPTYVLPYPMQSKPNVVFICSFHSDEPYLEVIKAASQIKKEITMYITGKHHNKITDLFIPENVHFTGYLEENNYWSLLLSADVIMDLTTRENCLVCGAYEAVAIGKPMILSKTEALKNYFNKGCVYTEPFCGSIAKSIDEILKKLNFYEDQVKELKEDLEKNWSSSLFRFEHVLKSRRIAKCVAA